ncbi:rplA family protein [Salinisphaera sp. C84B14]
MSRRWAPISLIVACVTALLLSGCAGLRTPGGVYQRGEAAYYASSFDGRRTASGDRFDSRRLTAAHRRLPFGSRVEVTNENNGRSVIVTINDRGPYTRGRIIDLSRRAAEKIDMIRSGVAPVTLRVLD